MKNALFIYNPFSGSYTLPNKIDYIIDRFQNNGILITLCRLTNDYDSITKILTKNIFDFVIISGGDGTLNSVVNILLKNEIFIPIGIIPSGTCNDFAASLNIPNSLDECLDIIIKGNTFHVDVGLINDTVFMLSTCAGGAFVEISFNTNVELKKNLGAFAYYIKALNEVANMKPFRLHLKTDTEIIHEKVLLFIILNGRQAGGFANILKEADISDGLMDIVLVKNCSHINLANLFFKVLNNNLTNDKYIKVIKTKTCTIQCSRELNTGVDGEKGPQLPLEVKFINKALEVYCEFSDTKLAMDTTL